MGSPLHTAETQAGTGLVAAYATYVGEREPDNTIAINEDLRGNTFHASLEIGAACSRLIRGDYLAAMRY